MSRVHWSEPAPGRCEDCDQPGDAVSGCLRYPLDPYAHCQDCRAAEGCC